MIENFDNYKFHCSALGKIYSAKGELTVANKTFLRQLFTEAMEGKRKEISSKFFEKGHFMEDDGIGMVNDVLYPNELLLKNKESLSNDFIEGTYDLLHKGIIYDIKNAWDVFTFGNADLTDDYEWQGRGYMWLRSCNHFRLFYCLNDMPDHLLIDEEKKLFYKHNFVTMEAAEYLKLCQELREFHNYDRKPIEERFKVWDVFHSNDKIEFLKEKIIKCRAYMNELLQARKTMIANNLQLMSGSSVAIASYDSSVSATIISPLPLKKII